MSSGRTHYQVLGVPASSTAQQIRSAYRKIVLAHHPDRSPDPRSKAIFLAATEAYSVLNDASARKQYDDTLRLQQELKKRQSAPQQRAASASAARQAPRPNPVREDLMRLGQIFSQGRYGDAEELARSIIQRDPRQAVPYAVLGDIARARGNRGEALKLYAYAVQFDGRNPVYQRRYEELLTVPIRTPTPSVRYSPEELKPRYPAVLVGFALLLAANVYILLAKEVPALPRLQLISTWTVGLIVMLFVSGLVIGTILSFEELVDNFASSSTSSLGKISPTLALGTVAILSFWLALTMYVILGATRKSFNFSTTRVISGVAGCTCVIALFAEASGRISGLQTFFWGGNLIYMGTLCGWIVTDALRSAT